MSQFEAVLFDCDGVLVDSEAITLGVLRDYLDECGWNLSMPEVRHHFLGRLVRDNRALIEANIAKPVTPEWTAEFLARRDAGLQERLEPVLGIRTALEQIRAKFGTRMACASGADRRKILLQLEKVGLLEFFEGRCFSGFEMAASKPAPDVYLAAAAALGVDIKRCAVVEDSPTGITAGVAAGATVFAYCAPDDPHMLETGGMEMHIAVLKALGVKEVFHQMVDLPALLGLR